MRTLTTLLIALLCATVQSAVPKDGVYCRQTQLRKPAYKQTLTITYTVKLKEPATTATAITPRPPSNVDQAVSNIRFSACVQPGWTTKEYLISDQGEGGAIRVFQAVEITASESFSEFQVIFSVDLVKYHTDLVWNSNPVYTKLPAESELAPYLVSDEDLDWSNLDGKVLPGMNNPIMVALKLKELGFVHTPVKGSDPDLPTGQPISILEGDLSSIDSSRLVAGIYRKMGCPARYVVGQFCNFNDGEPYLYGRMHVYELGANCWVGDYPHCWIRKDRMMIPKWGYSNGFSAIDNIDRMYGPLTAKLTIQGKMVTVSVNQPMCWAYSGTQLQECQVTGKTSQSTWVQLNKPYVPTP